jgi:hypothetical protein
VTYYFTPGGINNPPGTPRAINCWKSKISIDLPEVVMHDEHLTVDECDELAEALRQDAAAVPNGSEKAKLLKLSECYRDLAYIKRTVLRKVN